MRSYRDSLSRCIRMALLIVLLLLPALAIDPLGLNSTIGLTAPVSADDGKGWAGSWRSTWPGDYSTATMNLTLRQNGSQVSGDLELLYGKSLVEGSLTGTVSGNQCKATGTFKYISSRVDSYVFTLAPDGQSMTVAWDAETRSFLEKGVVYTLIRTVAGKGSGTGTGTAIGTGTGATTGTGADVKGDYNSDGKVTELDALAALKMSVKQLTVVLTLDMDGNGKVTAEDARLILKKALGK